MAKKRKIIPEKTLDSLIRGELAKGRSIEEIKVDLIEKGYDEDMVVRWTNKYFLKNYLVEAMFVVFLLGILPAVFLSSPSFTGYVVAKGGGEDFNALSSIYPVWIIVLLISVFVYLKHKFKH